MTKIDKFEAAFKRTLTMDAIDIDRGNALPNTPPGLINLGLEAIAAGIDCISDGSADAGDQTIHEAAIYFFNAGFLAGKEKT